MNRHAPTRRIIAVMMLGLTVGVSACGQGTADKAGEEVAAGDYERGPHRGRMLRDGDFALEVTIYEEGPEPLYRLYAYLKDKPVDPRQVQASIALTRLGGRVDRFAFTPFEDYLASPTVVAEPHSFDVSVAATHAGKRHAWAFPSYEGRTIITPDAARAGGVTTERAGSAYLGESLPLTGRIEITPEGLGHVLDFKTGGAPSPKQINTGFSPQLTLTMAILTSGGFEGLKVYAGDLTYLKVTGRKPAGEVLVRKPAGSDSEEAAKQAYDGVIKLLALYQDPERGYLSRTAPQFVKTWAGDHDHLARVFEWSTGSDGEAEE